MIQGAATLVRTLPKGNALDREEEDFMRENLTEMQEPMEITDDEALLE